MRKIYMVFAMLFAIIVSVCLLASCGNENWGPGNFTFTHAHIGDGTEGYCAKSSFFVTSVFVGGCGCCEQSG